MLFRSKFTNKTAPIPQAVFNVHVVAVTVSMPMDTVVTMSMSAAREPIIVLSSVIIALVVIPARVTLDIL